MVNKLSGAGLAGVWRILEGVLDPEVPALSVVDLGIVRRVAGSGRAVEVDLTPTYTGCPATAAIELAVRAALEKAGYSVTVNTVLSPPWTSDWITPEGREKLRVYGIAPPAGKAMGAGALFENGPAVACPRCGSMATEKVSDFGSTACKALMRCASCAEPFEYFKCH